MTAGQWVIALVLAGIVGIGLTAALGLWLLSG